MVFIGSFLSCTHLMSIRNVNIIWYSLWTGDNSFVDNSGGDIIIELMAESRTLQLTMENLPQLSLQLTNNILLGGNFTGLAIVSLSMTLYLTIDGLYLVYYYFIKEFL